MAGLDLNYISELIRQAQDGDSNAFAEFFAATYNQQYIFACHCLQDTFLAQEALEASYTMALKNISKLRDAMLSISWLTQYTMRSCCEIRDKVAFAGQAEAENTTAEEVPLFESRIVNIGGEEYTVQRIMNLPFAESQAILLQYMFTMEKKQIASLMEISPHDVKRYIASGLGRLQGAYSEKGGKIL